jgi:tetratricopeptide (TPR) repeat protein
MHILRLLTLTLTLVVNLIETLQIEVTDVSLVKSPGLGIKLVPRGSGVMVSGVRNLFQRLLELIGHTLFQVQKGSSAARCDCLRYGDVLLSVQGEAVIKRENFKGVLKRLKVAPKDVSLEFLRSVHELKARANASETALYEMAHTEEIIRTFIHSIQLLSQGDLSYQAEKIDEAMQYYNGVVELAPRNSEAIFNVGRCWQFKKQKDMAAYMYQQSVQLTPGHFARGLYAAQFFDHHMKEPSVALTMYRNLSKTHGSVEPFTLDCRLADLLRRAWLWDESELLLTRMFSDDAKYALRPCPTMMLPSALSWQLHPSKVADL